MENGFFAALRLVVTVAIGLAGGVEGLMLCIRRNPEHNNYWDAPWSKRTAAQESKQHS